MPVFRAQISAGIPKSWVRTLFLMLFFVFSFRTFQYFPGGLVIKDMWIVIVFLFLSSTYFMDKLRHGFRVTFLELYIILLILLVPLIAAITANQVFGQPLLYGILAQRNLILAGAVMLLLHFIRRGFFSLRDAERALVWLAWTCLVLFTLVSLTMDPHDFTEFGPGLVGGHAAEARFKFNTVFIVFGFFYYIFLGFWKKKAMPSFIALLFLLYIVFGEGGRSLLLAIGASYLYFIWRWSSLTKLLIWVPNFFVITLILISILFVVEQDYISHLGNKFMDAFSVVITGEKTSDASANSRIVESLTAWPYIKENWLMGNGDLSNKWQGGYDARFGYFHPTDIGILGVLFLYGLLGLLLFSVQFIFAFRYAKRLPRYGGEHFAFISAIKGFLVYYAIHSLVTGLFVHNVEIGLLFIAILYIASLSINRSADPLSVTRGEPSIGQ